MLYALLNGIITALAVWAALVYGRGRYKAGYNQARLEILQAEQKQSEETDKIIAANNNLDRGALLDGLRGRENKE